MCGIAGIWTKKDKITEHQLRSMGNRIWNRGPDNQGVFIDQEGNFGCVHQRLSIIDLDARANQPMTSVDGRYVICYNGEIYNFKGLRADLLSRGIKFLSRSDTEVLLTLYQLYGSSCLKLLNGMFAFSVYDQVNKELFVARDRLGIKPLYYYHVSDCFAFTSDLNAFHAHPQIQLSLYEQALIDYFYFDYVPQPFSIFENCFKLLPGHFLIVKMPGEIEMKKYWEIPIDQKESRSPKALVEEFITILNRSVKRRMISDVKVGAFLSGGLDSSAIVSQMEGEFPVYTIGFEYASNHLDPIRAKEVAGSFRLIYNLKILNDSALDDYIEFISDLDEPFAEASVVPLLANFEQARNQGVKVILSGDGADEILGGYSYMRWLLIIQKLKIYQKFLLFPAMSFAGMILNPISATSKPGKFRDIYIDEYRTLLNMDDPIQRHQFLFSSKTIQDMKNLKINILDDVRDSLLFELNDGSDFTLQRLLFSESKTSLVNRMLAKIDKTSMAHSIEARVPFMDHELVEFAFRLPDNMRVNKKILRLAMSEILPHNILSDRKRGFNLPIRQWVKKYILADIGKYIKFDALLGVNLLSSSEIDTVLKETKKTKRDYSRTIWSLLVLSNWLERRL